MQKGVLSDTLIPSQITKLYVNLKIFPKIIL